MSGPQDEPAGAAHRSRWRRFSPSMGWRAFWSEIVIVVLGVAIALAANEAVQDWTWRNKVKDAEARLQYDITWAFLWEAEKYVSVACVDAQLAALSRNVLDSGDTLKSQPIITQNNNVQPVVRLPNRPYRFPTWDALVADGTATHFTSQRQAFLSGVSNDQALSRESMAEMRRLRGRLMVMREELPLDPAVRADLLTSINELRSIITVESLKVDNSDFLAYVFSPAGKTLRQLPEFPAYLRAKGFPALWDKHGAPDMCRKAASGDYSCQ